MLYEDDFRIGLIRHMMSHHYKNGISSSFTVCSETGKCIINYEGEDYHFADLSRAVAALYATCPN